MADPFWVIDTSSVIQARRIDPSLARVRGIYAELSSMVSSGRLVYPKKVVEELDRYKNPKKPDLPYEWARANEKQATRFGPLFDELRDVLAHPQIHRVFDPHKSRGADEADPHVLALAFHLKREGAEVTVLSEESRSRPDKMSLQTACALLRIICLPIEPFLREQGLLPP